MKIQVFAVLKDYFDKEFELGAEVGDIASLQSELVRLNPSAKGILQLCRFAVYDEFVDNDFRIEKNDTICIFPPSSGG
ncbi:MoaD/ThiS family protein [uncultured Mucilaginibacter sp.]|uniref:MoaD/ThiS family protein n=1 Tax=uncultured Mucilaginibacter sp. TaxID=797541 RepID=UPI0025E70D09|nr:MoaD/ThiS family protein [uncultured Mucilaginibacter sp.]